MNALVIDLDAVRTKRAADLQAATEATKAVLDAVAEIASGYASLAFTFSGPLWTVNEQFAVDINRSQWRRQPEVKAQLLRCADVSFADQLLKLGADTNAMWGGAHG